MPNTLPKSTTDGKIAVADVRQVKGPPEARVTILEDINFTVFPRDIFTIVGPSGSGKSSLLRLLNRLDEPVAGTIQLDGQDISSIDVIELRRRVGMVFQLPALFPGTTQQNLLFGPQLHGMKNIDLEGALRAVELSPEILSRNVDTLSVGEQQRVCIARTLCNSPEILLMDEPTAALDPTTAVSIEQLILRLHSEMNITILLVTHDIRQAERLATRLVMMSAGKVIEEAAAEEFFNNPATEVARHFIAGEKL